MIVNNNNQAALSILSLVSLKSCIYRAGQCEEVSHHCCLVTASAPNKPQAITGLVSYQCTSKHHPADCVSSETVWKLNWKLMFRGRRASP